MPSQYSSSKRTIGDMLSTTSRKISVPKFQRNYSWDSMQVETFWEDLVSFSNRYPGQSIKGQEYFLGPMVLVEKNDEFLLLDGQQRLATATILFSVIRDELYHFGNTGAKDRIQNNYIADYDDYERRNRYNFTLNCYDENFFIEEIQTDRSVVGYKEPQPTLPSHYLIRDARTFLKTKFGKFISSLPSEGDKQGWVLRMQKILADHVSVIAVSSVDEDNAATVFETLNDRGIGLSTADLLRQFLLSNENELNANIIIECWKDVLSMEKSSSVDDFLRHFWISRMGDVKGRTLYRVIKDYIRYNNINPVEFSRDLQREARVYSDIINSRDEDGDCRRYLEALDAIGSKLSWPLVLSAYSINNLDERRKLLHDLVSLYIRHSTIGNLENSKIESFVFQLAKRLRETGDFAAARLVIKAFAPNDTQFTEDFKKAAINKFSTARYILKEIELAKRITGELTLEEDIEIVNLEHIQAKSALSQWPEQELWINRLGNLTLLLTKLNKDLKNADFATKKRYYISSDLLITKELGNYTDWKPSLIESRQNEFSAYAVNIWNFTT